MSDRNPQIGGRVTPALKRQIDDYREDHGDITQSEALRRLLEQGLEHDRKDVADDRGFAEKVTPVDLVVVGAIVILAEVVGLWAYAGLGAYAVALYLAHRYDIGRAA
jgi:hypothetical protein